MAVGYQVFQYWDIKSFYNQALNIRDDELDSVTWNEVQKRLVEAQSDYLMCIHKTQLTELDIYHRILRVKNYLVAMLATFGVVLGAAYMLWLTKRVIFGNTNNVEIKDAFYKYIFFHCRISFERR